MSDTGYYPKGSMCRQCTKRLDNCAHLPFFLMPVIEINTGIIARNGEYGKIVKCTEYVKDHAEV